jgi:hypothetical protein
MFTIRRVHVTLLPLWAFVACSRVDLTLTVTFTLLLISYLAHRQEIPGDITVIIK